MKLAGQLRYELLPRLNEFDYIYSFGTTASQMTKSLIKGKVPHIFNIVTEPVKAGIAESTESAGDKICGISPNISLVIQIENALKLKKINTLGYFFNSRETNSNIIRKELSIIADNYKFNLIVFRSPPAMNMLEKKFAAD